MKIQNTVVITALALSLICNNAFAKPGQTDCLALKNTSWKGKVWIADQQVDVNLAISDVIELSPETYQHHAWSIKGKLNGLAISAAEPLNCWSLNNKITSIAAFVDTNNYFSAPSEISENQTKVMIGSGSIGGKKILPSADNFLARQ